MTSCYYSFINLTETCKSNTQGQFNASTGTLPFAQFFMSQRPTPMRSFTSFGAAEQLSFSSIVTTGSGKDWGCLSTRPRLLLFKIAGGAALLKTRWDAAAQQGKGQERTATLRVV
ncbi:hypothetical protein Droror1_Dr00025473 [Drosera rotundifolia]